MLSMLGWPELNMYIPYMTVYLVISQPKIPYYTPYI